MQGYRSWAQKVNSSRLWASISRRTELPSRISSFVSARALSNDRPHPNPPAKSVVVSQTRTSSSGIPLSAWHRHLPLPIPPRHSLALRSSNTSRSSFPCVLFQAVFHEKPPSSRDLPAGNSCRQNLLREKSRPLLVREEDS